MRWLLTVLLAASAYAGELKLQWDDNSQHEDEFRVYRAIDGKTFILIGKTPKDINKFTDKDVPIGEIVSYRVTAYNNKWGETPPSNTLEVNTIVEPPSNLRKAE